MKFSEDWLAVTLISVNGYLNQNFSNEVNILNIYVYLNILSISAGIKKNSHANSYTAYSDCYFLMLFTEKHQQETVL